MALCERVAVSYWNRRKAAVGRAAELWCVSLSLFNNFIPSIDVTCNRVHSRRRRFAMRWYIVSSSCSSSCSSSVGSSA